MELDAMQPFEAGFTRYAARYLGGDDFAHRVKLDHSLRVYAEATALAGAHRADLAQAGVPHRAALLAGLFHDVGRFEQFARWRTFNDRLSANHARLSVRCCLREGLLDGAEPEERRLVYGAIMLHNRRSVRRPANDPLGLLARLTRDADKLDIYRVMLDYFTPGGEKPSFMRLEAEEHPDNHTAEVLDCLMQGRMASYELLRWSNDFKLLMLSWVHDLNLPATARAFLDRDYVGRMAALLPSAPAFSGMRETLRAKLVERAESRAIG